MSFRTLQQLIRSYRPSFRIQGRNYLTSLYRHEFDPSEFAGLYYSCSPSWLLLRSLAALFQC